MTSPVQIQAVFKTLERRGITLRRAGRYEEALEHYESIREAFEAENEYYRHWLCGVGLVHYVKGDFETAIGYFDKALSLDYSTDDELLDLAAVNVNRANASLELKRPNEALTFLIQPEEYFRKRKAMTDLGETLETKARILHTLGRPEAKEVAKEAFDILFDCGDSNAEMRVRETLELCREARGVCR